MIHQKYILTLCLLSIFLFSCEKEDVVTDPIVELRKSNLAKITIEEGITGTLLLIQGNCMPMIATDNSKSTCTSNPIQRTISVYEYTTQNEVVGNFTLFDTVKSKLVSETISDEEGFFELKLSKGLYSVFIKEKGKFYANGSDGTGGINPVEIFVDSVTVSNFAIDYAAY